MTEEHRIQNEIRAALAPTCIVFRMNVGAMQTADGRYFRTGVPAGFSDLFGFRKSDGKAVFIEVKTKTGRVSAQQLHFFGTNAGRRCHRRSMQKCRGCAKIDRRQSEMMDFGKKPETSFELLPEGDYEAIVSEVKERCTQNGSRSVSVSFCIRNDVEQPGKNRRIFMDIWAKKQPNQDDIQVGGYNYVQLYHLLETTGVLARQKGFETMVHLCATLTGTLARITVHHETYNGRTNEKIDQLKGVNQTKAPDCRHVWKQAAQSPAYDTPAQKPQEQFAHAAPPAPVNQGATAFGSLDDFEEILGDSDVPF